MRKPVRVRDLKDQIGTPCPRPFLYCPRCGSQYSANAGDYFMSSPDSVMQCCGVNSLLVVERRALVEVTNA